MVTGTNDKPANNNGNGATIDPGYVDPAIAAAAISGTGTAKKRGRPTGSTNRAKAQTAPVSLNISTIEKLLFSIHASLAIGLQTPEFALNPEEAKELAKAVADVQACYNVSLSPETAAWINLSVTLATIYGTHSVNYVIRRSQQTKQAVKSSATNQADEPRRGNGKDQIFDFGFNPMKIELPN